MHTVIKAYPKLTTESFTVEAEILALPKDLVQVKVLSIFNLIVERDSTVVISWVTKKERGSGGLMYSFSIFFISVELGCSFSRLLI